jgi:hypothetical protein
MITIGGVVVFREEMVSVVVIRWLLLVHEKKQILAVGGSGTGRCGSVEMLIEDIANPMLSMIHLRLGPANPSLSVHHDYFLLIGRAGRGDG